MVQRLKQPKKFWNECVTNNNCRNLPKGKDQYGGYKDPSKRGKFRRIENGNWVSYFRTYSTKKEAQTIRNDLKNYLGANHVRVFPSFSGFEVWVND